MVKIEKHFKKERTKTLTTSIKEVKIFPELFKIGGCREEKSELRIWDATATTQGKKCLLKSQLYSKTCIY